MVNGNGNTTDTECLVTMQQSDIGFDFPLSKRFGVSKVPKSKVMLEIHTTVQFYLQQNLVSLEVINNELISAIEGST